MINKIKNKTIKIRIPVENAKYVNEIAKDIRNILKNNPLTSLLLSLK
ncbi:MAG: hypothetical protein ACRDDE_02940 [Paraclostridium sp.]